MKLLLITAGGTISQYDEDGVHVSRGHIANQGFLDNVRNNPKNKNIEIDINNIFNIDSTFMTPAHWNKILDLLREKHDEYDAFCITHGTNTMGQFSAALSFGLESFHRPVYITGSQVPFGVEGADANQNFENLIKLAREHHRDMKGVFVVMGSTVVQGTRAKKTSDSNYAAFSAFQANTIAMLGARSDIMFDQRLLAQNNEMYSESSRPQVFSAYPNHILSSLNDFIGMDGNDVKVLVEHLGKKGFLYRGVGAADISQEMLDVLPYLWERKIPIAITTQIPTGIASMDMNEPGMEAMKRGAIPVFDMSIESMNTKMSYLIAKGIPFENFKREMLTNLKGEINADKFKSEIKRVLSGGL